MIRHRDLSGYSSSFAHTTTVPLVRNDPDGPHCQLLGPFALIVQASMGLLAVASLVIKRSREHPQRPWKIWFFDVSKQVWGAAGLHVLNLLLSIISSRSKQPDVDDNPCNWYFINVLLDTTVGIPVLWFFLHNLHDMAFNYGIKDTVSGQYGDPPRWRAFFRQATIYFMALICMKCVLYAICFIPWLDDLGAFLISWTNWNAQVQVAFVMLVFPFIMNTIQYYVIDTIIQSPKYHPSSSEICVNTCQQCGGKYDEETQHLTASSSCCSSPPSYSSIK